MRIWSTWVFWLSILLLIILFVDSFGVAQGWWDVKLGLTFVPIIFYASVVLALLGMINFVLGVFSSNGFLLIRGFFGALIAGICAYIIYFNLWLLSDNLFIYDYTTSGESPPDFVVAPQTRMSFHNSSLYQGVEAYKLQQERYPDLKTIISDLSYDDAFARSLAVAKALHWQILLDDQQQGLIEATKSGFWFGFQEDIIILVQQRDDGKTTVDLRVQSRLGSSDYGRAARAIATFIVLYNSDLFW